MDRHHVPKLAYQTDMKKETDRQVRGEGNNNKALTVNIHQIL